MSALKKSSVFVAAAVFVGLFVSSARAQGIVTVKVPFPFVVAGRDFPAGRYDIRPDDESGAVVLIRGTDNRSASFAITIPADGHDPAGDLPALVFTKYETGYRLSEIWETRTQGRALAGASAVSKTARVETKDGPSAAPTYLLVANWK